MTKTKAKYDLLPFHVISAATKGDPDALNIILKHYDGYIASLCTRTFKDEFGNIKTFIDEEMREKLRIRLITRTLAFKMNV